MEKNITLFPIKVTTVKKSSKENKIKGLLVRGKHLLDLIAFFSKTNLSQLEWSRWWFGEFNLHRKKEKKKGRKKS